MYSDAEASRVERLTGKKLPDVFAVLDSKDLTCPLLDPAGHCSIYIHRPLIQPGESAEFALDLTKEQILELLYAISQGGKPGLAFSCEDPDGNTHDQFIPFEREHLERMLDLLDSARKKPGP
jgi:hypothetical protein